MGSYFADPYSVNAYIGSDLKLNPDDHRSAQGSSVSLVATAGSIYAESDGSIVVSADSRALKLASISAVSAGRNGYTTGQTLLSVFEDGSDTGRDVVVSLYIYAAEYPDVSRGDWFAAGDDDRFDYVIDKGIVRGYSNNGCFGPYDYLLAVSLLQFCGACLGSPMLLRWLISMTSTMDGIMSRSGRDR